MNIKMANPTNGFWTAAASVAKYRLFSDDEWKRIILEAEKVSYFERQLNFWFYKADISLLKADFDNRLLGDLTSKENLPDIIIMDLKMPLINGVEATKIIHKDFPQIRIIALSSYNTKSFIANMINVGAASYLVKSATPQDMIKTINEVANKGFYYSESVMEVIHQDVLSSGNAKTVLDEDFLTLREKEVLELICLQHSSAEIAEKLFLSARTVDGHRNNLLLIKSYPSDNSMLSRRGFYYL